MDAHKPFSRFFESTRDDQRIGITHICVFASLLQYRHANGLGNPIQAYSYEIMAIAKISDIKTYCRCMREMSAYGYLRYEPSKKKNKASTIYFNE